jgi:hypothetical protein
MANITQKRTKITSRPIGQRAAMPASAAFQVESITGGFLPPVLTTAQITAITNPAEGLIVYDVTVHKLKVRTAAAWEVITSA